MEAIEMPVTRALLPRATAELWDLAEDVGRLLEQSDDLDLTPACCGLLLVLDDAITAAVRDAADAGGGRPL